MLAEHVWGHDVDVAFALVLVALILSAVLLIQSRLTSLIAWGAGLTSLTLVLEWWPD